MKKFKKEFILLIAILSLILGSSFYNSFPKEFKSPLFYYDYDCEEFTERLETKRYDAIFYILEKPIIKKWEHGNIEIDSVYYDGYALNLRGYITSNDDSFNKDINDKNSSAYFDISGLKFKKLKLSSYAIDLIEKNDSISKYKFFMGCFTKTSKCEKIIVNFENINIDIKLSKVIGTPINI